MIDKKTIGLTPSGETVMAKLMEQGFFKDMIDAAKFAMSIAVRESDIPTTVEGASTSWNVGSFDSDGQLRQIIPALYPGCETPYRAAESLIDQGLSRLSVYMELNTFDPVALLRDSTPANSP